MYVPSRAWHCLCMVLIKGGLTLLIDVVKQASKGNSIVLLTSITYTHTHEFNMNITKILAMTAITALAVAAATAI